MTMLKMAAAGVMLLASAGAGFAQTGLGDQVMSAHQLFAGGLDIRGFADAKYYDAMIADIGGSWIEASALISPDFGPEELTDYMVKACGRFPIAITAPAPLTLKTTLTWRDDEVPTTYVYMGGTSFAATSDTTAVLKRLGVLDKLSEMPSVGLHAMAMSNGVFDIYRVSSDVIAFTSAGKPPRLLARCGSSGPVAESEANVALRQAIERAFDRDFAKLDAQTRATFIACAMDALASLTEADRKLLAETDFNPPREEQKRIETAYPGVSAAVQVCAEPMNAK